MFRNSTITDLFLFRHYTTYFTPPYIFRQSLFIINYEFFFYKWAENSVYPDILGVLEQTQKCVRNLAKSE